MLTTFKFYFPPKMVNKYMIKAYLTTIQVCKCIMRVSWVLREHVNCSMNMNIGAFVILVFRQRAPFSRIVIILLRSVIKLC